MIKELLRPYLNQLGIRSKKRGEVIYNEGDAPENLYIIESGLVGLFHISETGSETFLRVFSKDYLFGHRSFLAEEPYHASSVALTQSTLLVIPKEIFEEIYTKEPKILREIAKILAKELRNSEIRLSGLQDKSAHTRISESLIFLKYRHPSHVWTRKEIAEFSGSTFETVTRVMTKLAEKGLIEKQGRDFTIPDTQKLINFSKGKV